MAPQSSTRAIKSPSRYIPQFTVNKYDTTNSNIEEYYLYYDDIIFHGMTQYYMKEQLKHFGKRVYKSLSSELHKMHIRYSFYPLNPRSLSNKNNVKELKSHIFLNQKDKSSIKCRIVAGVEKLGLYNKERFTSPTATLESVILTIIANAHEESDKDTIGNSKSFIHSDVR